MRDAREWAAAAYIDPQYLDDLTDMIRAIQSDAARSERERCAMVCSDPKITDRAMRLYGEWFAAAIKDLPDVPERESGHAD